MNCNSQVIDNFCHVCGQENIEPRESFLHIVTHFFNDITHFDGKFFSSVKHIIFKPGFLSKEYISGRRVTYLNPVRMYLFTSAFFFIIFFSLYDIDETDVKENTKYWGKTSEEIEAMDSLQLTVFTKKMNKGIPLAREQVLHRIDTTGFKFTIANDYRSKEQYDSLIKAGGKKYSWFERQMINKSFAIKEKHGSNGRVVIAALMNKFMHLLPQMLFILLPLFALILKLIYIRRKEFYYVDHIIFTIHLYIFVFLMMLITFGIFTLRNYLHWNWLNYIGAAFIFTIFFYFYKALRNFYKQRRAKTILKYFILLLLFFIVTLIMFIVFFFFSIFRL